MILKCANCGKTISLDSNQEKFVLESKEKGMTFIMLKCSQCSLTFRYNPQKGNTEIESEEIVWHSPISGSLGFVSLINTNPSFFGCSETGAIWYKRENFYRDIQNIINKYPHRAEFYIKEKEHWYPSNISLQKVKKLVATEEKTELNSYIMD